MKSDVVGFGRMAGAAREKNLQTRARDLPWICSLDALVEDATLADPKSVGGKAAQLAWLRREGFDVPETWVLSQRAFRAALRDLPALCEPRSLLRSVDVRDVHSRAAAAREAIRRATPPGRLLEELEEICRRTEGRAPWGFAVRSSATREDGPLQSMAGLAESVLGVRGPEHLFDAIRRVWASIASGRALVYMAHHGVRDVGMAVVIQPVVQAVAAGVMFTSGGSARERIVNVGLGLGSPVVDGVASPDMLRISADGHIVEQTIARKQKALVVGVDGLEERRAESPDKPALSSTHVAQLASIASRLEELEDIPWDVEFACEGDRVWVVQARHVTGLGFPEGGDASTVWSNVNVGEALPGVATPFTWSVAGAYSEAGFRKAFGALGCRVPKSTRLIGNVHGRFYLNLSEFMSIGAQVPWLDPRTLVELGGGAGGEELAAQIGRLSRGRFLARLPITLTKLVREQLRLDERVKRFEEDAERALRHHKAMDLTILPDDGLARKIREIQKMLGRTGDVMLTCSASALGLHIVLKRILSHADPQRAERLTQDLTRGIRDLESARPAIGVMRLVDLAKNEPSARAALEGRIADLGDLPEGPTKRALRSFLQSYGDRAVREAELSTPRWVEDPSPILAMIGVALRGGAHGMEQRLERVQRQADTELRETLGRLNVAERTLVRHLVVRVQKAARLRERMRAWVTRVLGMLRHAALDADRRLLRLAPHLARDWSALTASESILHGIPTVFFLTIDEVVSALSRSQTDLAPLVRARRADYVRDRSRPDPPATFVGRPPAAQLPPSGGSLLRGTAASAGVVEGRARVLSSPAQIGELELGEVLVVHTTDVGWTPLFCLAAGVVTELGGALSHAAVVARELGVPSVVNVDGVTRSVRTGDRVRVDGDRGTVERLLSVVAGASSP